MWKDDQTLRAAMAQVRANTETAATLFVAVGRESAVAGTGQARTRSIPFQHDPRVMAQYYRAADLYLHAARADTFPLAVLESMGCGTPVIATGVGGIPEQIDSAAVETIRADAIGDATGVLIGKGDARRMAEAAIALLTHEAARSRMGANAAARTRAKFDVSVQVTAYLDWFQELVA
jgi:glycosyltransferase involved in cell wall biosynthesis